MPNLFYLFSSMVFFLLIVVICFLPLQKNLHLVKGNFVSNPSRNGIPDGLETKFLILKTLVRDFFLSLSRDGLETTYYPSLIPKTHSVSNQRRICSVSDQRPKESISNYTKFSVLNSVSDKR